MGVSHINLQGGQTVSLEVEVSVHRPLRGGVRAVEGVFELDDCAVLVLQDAVFCCVVIHQL